MTLSRAPLPGRLKAIAAFALASLVALAAWWWMARPVAVVDAPSGKVPCVSYAPYRGQQTPFDEDLVVPRAQIEADLRILATRTRCVRTYAVNHGLDVVPEIAHALGLKVMLGAWVGRETAKNERELARAIDLANRYPETIRALVVGNEVLLRREQPADRLAELIRSVKARVPVPVTYADVWEFWLKNPEIAGAVDFITVHMLPYWEDRPIAVEDAVPHVLAIWEQVARAFPGKSIFIGEAGWPSAGRMREGARPSIVNQARFVRELLAVTAKRGIGVNLIEAFDQPWKRKLEGTVGGHWGLFDADRHAKFAMTGPVSDWPHWSRQATVAMGLALLPLLAVLQHCPGIRFWRALVLAAAAEAAAAALGVAAGEAINASLTLLDWAVAGGRLALALAAFALVSRALMRPNEGRTRPSTAELLAAAATRRLPSDWRAPTSWLALVRLLTLLAAAATTLALLVDPRYRDFPVAATAVPAAAFLWLAWRRPAAVTDGREDGLLAAVLGLGGLAVLAAEGLENTQALAWAAVTLALAFAVVLDRRRAAVPQAALRREPPGVVAPSRSERISASSSAIDAGPAA